MPCILLFSYAGLQALPAIVIQHWYQWAYIPLRMYGVLFTATVLIPSIALSAVETPKNPIMARAFSIAIRVAILVVVATGVIAAAKIAWAAANPVYLIIAAAAVIAVAILYYCLNKVSSGAVTEIIHESVTYIYRYDRWLVRS